MSQHFCASIFIANIFFYLVSRERNKMLGLSPLKVALCLVALSPATLCLGATHSASDSNSPISSDYSSYTGSGGPKPPEGLSPHLLFPPPMRDKGSISTEEGANRTPSTAPSTPYGEGGANKPFRVGVEEDQQQAEDAAAAAAATAAADDDNPEPPMLKFFRVVTQLFLEVRGRME